MVSNTVTSVMSVVEEKLLSIEQAKQQPVVHEKLELVKVKSIFSFSSPFISRFRAISAILTFNHLSHRVSAKISFRHDSTHWPDRLTILSTRFAVWQEKLGHPSKLPRLWLEMGRDQLWRLPRTCSRIRERPSNTCLALPINSLV